jgi:hypothetical protein
VEVGQQGDVQALTGDLLAELGAVFAELVEPAADPRQVRAEVTCRASRARSLVSVPGRDSSAVTSGSSRRRARTELSLVTAVITL